MRVIRTSIGHGESTRLSVEELKVLILKSGTIDALATTAITQSDVTTLERRQPKS